MAVVASVVVVVVASVVVVAVVVTFQSPFSSSSSFSSLSWTLLETISSFGSVKESSPPMTVSFPSNDPVDDGDTSTDCTNGMILPNDHTDIIDTSSSSILIRSSSCGCVDGRILRGVL